MIVERGVLWDFWGERCLVQGKVRTCSGRVPEKIVEREVLQDCLGERRVVDQSERYVLWGFWVIERV